MAEPKDTATKPTLPISGARDIPFFGAREGIPTGETVTLTPEQQKARRQRSRWIALALFAFVVLIFVITITKLGANVLVRDL
jgi:hypothetical protein